jgi:hypothetical protein
VGFEKGSVRLHNSLHSLTSPLSVAFGHHVWHLEFPSLLSLFLSKAFSRGLHRVWHSCCLHFVLGEVLWTTKSWGIFIFFAKTWHIPAFGGRDLFVVARSVERF